VSNQLELLSPEVDDKVDTEILQCLDPTRPRSFFLYAGAGSGKTRSLKLALDAFRTKHGSSFRSLGKKIAVITYTNAATEEISKRLGEDLLFPVKTIHSFCWAHIGTYHTDIQRWLLEQLPKEFVKLLEEQARGQKRVTKASQDRLRAMEEISRRLEWLKEPRRFVYNPNGDNFGADSLSHSEVLQITASFIKDKPSMQEVIVNRYPFLLIDESQDTNKHLMNALFALADSQRTRFALGLFGDRMQRIYNDGLAGLGNTLPDGWANPVKKLNHRSTRRVISLANAIRAGADGQRQAARNDSAEGFVRIFLAQAGSADPRALEVEACKRMAGITKDEQWLDSRGGVKTLTLEHHMAAARDDFLPMFQALDMNPSLRPGLRKGELAGLRLFTERVAPLLAAKNSGNSFGVMQILRSTASPLLKAESLSHPARIKDPLQPARVAVNKLARLVKGGNATFSEVLQCVARCNLFEIPSTLRPFIERNELEDDQFDEEVSIAEDNNEPKPGSSQLEAWRIFLETPYNQIDSYAAHVRETGPFGTHQGVKGLQFDRVMVVLDDKTARGFLFSYEKLLAEPASESTTDTEDEKPESTIEATRRLLYVTCTRAKQSLALVMYASAPDALTKNIMDQAWFTADEIVRLDGTTV
jgi:DNA helicase-2/ATP-dependent DNA helicase PcrA